MIETPKPASLTITKTEKVEIIICLCYCLSYVSQFALYIIISQSLNLFTAQRKVSAQLVQP